MLPRDPEKKVPVKKSQISPLQLRRNDTGAIETETTDRTTANGIQVHTEKEDYNGLTSEGSYVTSGRQYLDVRTPRGSEIHLGAEVYDELTSSGDKLHVESKHSDYISRKGSTRHLETTRSKLETSDGGIFQFEESDTCVKSSHGLHYHKHATFFSQSSPPHPLDLLKVGKEYNVENFIGSVPSLVAGALTSYWSPQSPVWGHETCKLTVRHSDNLGKHVTLKAKVYSNSDNSKETNTPYGVQGEYEIEVCLQKQGSNTVCTQITGKSGKFVMPNALYYSASLAVMPYIALYGQGSCNFDDVGSYSAGTVDKPLALPVELSSNGDGTFAIKIVVDPNGLKIESWLANLMLGIISSAGYGQPAELNGKIDLRSELLLGDTVQLQISNEGNQHSEEKDVEAARVNSVNDFMGNGQAGRLDLAYRQRVEGVNQGQRHDVDKDKDQKQVNSLSK